MGFTLINLSSIKYNKLSSFKAGVIIFLLINSAVIHLAMLGHYVRTSCLLAFSRYGGHHRSAPFGLVWLYTDKFMCSPFLKIAYDP